MARLFFVLFIILGIDLYVFRTFQNQFSNFSNPAKYSIYVAYWLVPILLLGATFYLLISSKSGGFRTNKMVLYIAASLVLFYLPKLLIIFFQLTEDISKLFAWFIKKISQPESVLYSNADKISRSVFIGRLGLIFAAIPFLSIIYGIIQGRFNFTVKKLALSFDHLPSNFDGYRIVQFSDFHAGSLLDQQKHFSKAIELINDQQADLIVFTGDLVNNNASEMEDWVELLSKLKAKEGKYSILGNHDYGDYATWESEEAKIANLDKLKEYHKKIGFQLLLNDTAILEREDQQIALLGVENWGEKPFPQHGRLDIALEKSNDLPFKILLSHDPSHWDHEVIGKTDIALTLSGHTHGMQLAINIAGLSLSPVSLKYPRWKGLYTEKNQHLYVNIGLGYIGFPGRVGTDPEITVFDLKTATTA